MCIARTACRTNRLVHERANNGKTLWHSHAVWVALCAQGDSAGSIDTAFGKPLWRPKHVATWTLGLGPNSWAASSHKLGHEYYGTLCE